MPPLSMTMSSSIAAATAMPASESAVRSGCRRRLLRPQAMPLIPRPQSTIGRVRTSRHAAAAPAARPSTSESATLNSTMSGCDQREHERGIEEPPVVGVGGGAGEQGEHDADAPSPRRR